MKVSDYLVAWLEHKGIHTVFELTGGMIVTLLDAFCRQGRVRVVSMHHEQAAAFAADAFGRMTGLPGVAMATSGPGAINLLTGLGSCHFDSSPALFLTGQVNRHEQKKDRRVRQLGFQETDIVSMAQPIAKAAWRIQASEEIPSVLERAFVLATGDRPGPVLLDLPMDLQRAEIPEFGYVAAPPTSETPVELEEAAWQALSAALKTAQRPLIIAGGGIRSGRAAELLLKFVECTGIPAVHSLMGVDVLPYDHPLRVGMLGSYGNRWANWAVGSSDLLLVLGSRLDVRQTGSETQSFSKGRAIFHVDCDESEVNNRVVGCTALICQLRDFLTGAMARRTALQPRDPRGWIRQIAAKRAEWPDVSEIADVPGINPNEFMHALSRASEAASAYVVDTGQHQMWAAQSLELTVRQRFLTSGGMGSMGFALPAAVGVAFAQPGEPVVVIAGDGGIQCNLQELQTVVRNRLPVKLVVINNHCLGMVRQFQESYFESRFQSTIWGYSAPDFVRLAGAFGIEARRVSEPGDVTAALGWLWSNPAKPMLLEVEVAQTANVYPKMAFGRPITDMEPFVKSKQMEGT